MSTAQEIRNLVPAHDTLVGIDSDGCVFDSMGVKQKTCFHPVFIAQWGLEAVEKPVRQVLEFVNLYSSHRGQDRFVAFARSVDLMRQRADIIGAGVTLPDTTDLKTWLAGPGPFGNDGLQQTLANGPLAGSPGLAAILAWSLEIDQRVRALAPIPAFPHALDFLAYIQGKSDALVVSSTPLAALENEWEHAGIRSRVRAIASKDIGTKVEHLSLALAGGKYAPERVLMLGDAPKDLASAQTVGVRFFPIMPGDENRSWKILLEVVYPRFLAGKYTTAEEEHFVKAFTESLPESSACG